MKADLLQLPSLLTWWWLPSLGSQILLNLLYSLRILPPATSPRLRATHTQLSRTFIIVGTLFYQLYTASASAPPNYYTLLSLPLDVDAEGVKRSFRALARRYHPDKVGEQGEAIFILLRRAHDALSDPNKRFAYDRFGPSVVEWKDCESSRDYMRRGLTGLVAFYTINPALYAAVGYISGRSDGVSFWRLSCLFALLAFELQLLVSPDYPTWLSLLLPNTTIYELRELCHSLFVNYFFASLQLSAALDVLEYGTSATPRSTTEAERLRAVQAKAQATDEAAHVVRRRLVEVLAGGVKPLRGEKGEVSGEQEKLLRKVDAVLLGRSLVQQYPSLAVEKGEGEGVKVEFREEEAQDVPVTVKRGPLDEVLPEKATAVKAEEAISKAQIKKEPVDELLETRDDQLVAAEAKPVVEVATVESVDSGSRVDPPEAGTAPPPHAEVSEQVAASAPDEQATALPPQAPDTAVAFPPKHSSEDTAPHPTTASMEQLAAADLQQSNGIQ